MGSPQISIAYDDNQDHIMGMIDNHIDQGTSLSPEDELLTHRHGVKRELLMERCSPEEMKETVAVAATTLGGSGPWPPYSTLDMVLVCNGSPPQGGCLGEEFSWCPLTQVSSLYKDSRIPVIQITSSVDRGYRKHPNSDLVEFVSRSKRKTFSTTFQF